ncbi:MAG TPA: TraM recognition domain-containing protein [Nevskiaceae bacterium]|nr:TraM recognition domain-containing protein [Nevskiaceae bacterium]
MGMSFADLQRLRFGGTADATAISAVILGGILSSPLALGAGAAGMATTMGLSAAGGTEIGRRLASAIRLDTFGDEKIKLHINSSEVPELKPGERGMHLGYVVDSGKPLIIPMSEWVRHGMIVGQSGVGKTVLAEWLLLQQIASGGGVLWVDGKLDSDNLGKLWAMCAWCGRELDLMVVNPGNPAMSNTYNPSLDGDADEIAARYVGMIPTSEGNAGTDFYRQNSTIAITTLVAAIQSLGLAYNFTDIRVLLTSDRGITTLLNLCQKIGQNGMEYTPEGRALGLFVDQFRVGGGKGGQPGAISMERMRQVFGGLGSRLAQFSQGDFGKVMDTYMPDVRLYDCIRQKKVVYVMLPTMGKSEAASALGKLFVNDLRSAIARVQKLPKAERPNPPMLNLFDEAASFVTQTWGRMFEQSRSARMMLLPAFQTKSGMETIGKELLAMVAGNTTTKAIFSPGEPETAKWLADIIGKEFQTQYSVSASAAASHKDAAATERMRGTVDSDTRNNNLGYSESIKEDYKISQDELMLLDKGECVVTYQGNRVYHIRVPFVNFTDEFMREIGPFKVQRGRPHSIDGLNMLDRIAGKRQDAPQEGTF